MLRDGAHFSPRRFEVLSHVALSQHVKTFDQLRRYAVFVGADEGQVKRAMAAHAIESVCIGFILEKAEQQLGFGARGVSGTQTGFNCGIRLDLQAQRENLLGVDEGQCRHEVAAIGMGLQQPLLFQSGERFTQRDLADAELFGKRILPDWSKGREATR